MVNTVKPGDGFDKDSIVTTQQIEEGASKKIAAAEGVKEEGPLQFLIDIVPTNIGFPKLCSALCTAQFKV